MQGGAAMMSIEVWEYLIILLRADGTYDSPANGQENGNLNDLARLGWEVDKVLNWQGVSGYALLHRPLALGSGEPEAFEEEQTANNGS